MFDLLRCLNMDADDINRAYDNICSLMDDLNMKEESDILTDYLAEELKDDNPFLLYKNGHIDLSPTNKVIRLLYKVTDETIKKKYPNAVTTYCVDGYRSSFNIDSNTYQTAINESRAMYD